MGVLFQEDKGWHSWSKLARPVPRVVNETTKPRLVRAGKAELSSLESMPAELLTLVLGDSSLERQDVISLGFASDLLWLHVLQHIEKECPLDPAPWADTEIACTGTYLTDLPPSFEKDGLAHSSTGVSTETWWGDQMGLARRINWAAVGNFEKPGENLEDAWRDAFIGNTNVAPDIPKARLARMSRELFSVSSQIRHSDIDGAWALRNLTTREYVRCRPGQGPAGRRGLVDHPEARWLRLDDVLLMRICWTSLGHGGDDSEKLGIYRGQWAGHCFDIVALDADELVVNEEWRDITGRVVGESQQLLKQIDPARSYRTGRPKRIARMTKAVKNIFAP